MPDAYVEVVPDLGARGMEKSFCYRVPPELQEKVALGSLVQVPLGRQVVAGFVVGWVEQPPGVAIRDIAGVAGLRPLGPDLLDLARWMGRRYFYPLGAVLGMMVPPPAREGTGRQRRYVSLAVPPEVAAAEAARLETRAPAQARVLRGLVTANGLAVEELGPARRSLAALVARGLVRAEDYPVYREGYPGVEEMADLAGPPALSAEQQEAVARITEAVEGARFAPFLLHGVTASGKTEVYLRLIAALIRQGRQCLFLVPEIALVPQVVAQLRRRLGGDQVVVWHSSLSAGQRHDAWERAASGLAGVVVGTRSAIFAPVPHLGLVVLDEEQEPAYKEDQGCRYHAREVALKRCQITRAVLVMGSATPGLETYVRAGSGSYRLVRLQQRVTGTGPPQVGLVDMREEVRAGNTGIFSRLLVRRLQEVLAAGRQALIFINRRGFYPYVYCGNCRFVWRCPHCDVGLTYHRAREQLRCHYCGYTRPYPQPCPACGATRVWQGRGAGTQQVETELRKLFPAVDVLRVDLDTTRSRDAHLRYYEQFHRGQAGILVGTQMIAKGLNFPRVTLVGVVNADNMLNLPDFRARERTFQLLSQVAGRAGRGELPGEVIVQTYWPEEESYLALAGNRAEGFYQAETERRRQAGYPPFTSLVRLLFMSREMEESRAAAEFAAQSLTEFTGPELEVLGPTPAPLTKVRDQFRWQVFLKGRKLQLLYRALRQVMPELYRRYPPPGRVIIVLDVDPQNML
ncbi:MAG: primosomal protein N' [Clostridia bacterium]|nr:MAG: primosomal protein N' [Clostridia bacterium]